MGLVWKPHEFTVWKLVPTITDGVLVRSDWVEGEMVNGLLVEKSPTEARGLIDLECRNPAVILLDEHADIELGDRLEIDGVRYRVVVDPLNHTMGLPTDHSRLIVERLD